jgi:hypothetical protein
MLTKSEISDVGGALTHFQAKIARLRLLHHMLLHLKVLTFY